MKTVHSETRKESKQFNSPNFHKKSIDFGCFSFLPVEMKWRKQHALFRLLFLLAVVFFAFAQIDCASHLPDFVSSFDFHIAVKEESASPHGSNNRMELTTTIPSVTLPSETEERGHIVRVTPSSSAPSLQDEPRLSLQTSNPAVQQVDDTKKEKRTYLLVLFTTEEVLVLKGNNN